MTLSRSAGCLCPDGRDCLPEVLLLFAAQATAMLYKVTKYCLLVYSSSCLPQISTQLFLGSDEQANQISWLYRIRSSLLLVLRNFKIFSSSVLPSVPSHRQDSHLLSLLDGCMTAFLYMEAGGSCQAGPLSADWCMPRCLQQAFH